MNNLNQKKITAVIAAISLLGLVMPQLTAANGVELPNPIQCDSLPCVLIQVIKLFLGVIGLFGTFMFIYGGFLMLISGGNADTIKRGKDTLVWSAIGIVVVLLSWAAVVFITKIIVNTSF